MYFSLNALFLHYYSKKCMYQYTLKVNTLHTPSKVNTSKYPTYTLRTLINLINVKNVNKFLKKFEQKNCDQGVHDHDVLVDLVHIPDGGKKQISPKLELCRANQDQIRNQRPRLRRNRLFLGRKEGGGFPTSANQLSIF